MAETNAFDASPDNKVAADQIQQGLQGLEGMVSGVQGSEIAEKQHAEEKKKEKDRASFTMTSEQIAQAYAEMGEAIAQMHGHVHEMGEKLVELTTKANEILDNLDNNIAEMTEKLSRQKGELRDLEEGLENSGDKELQLVLIDLKKAEIENTQSLKDLYKELKESTSENLIQATQEYEIAQKTLESLQEQKSAAENSNDPQGQLEVIKRQIAEAEQQVQAAQQSIEKIENHAELASNIITFGASELQIESRTCSLIEDEIQKIAITSARTALTKDLTAAIKDGVISEAEASNLMDLSAKAGITQEDQMQFAKGVAKAGIAIQTPDGALTGAAAETYLLSEFDKLRQEKTAALDETQENIAGAQGDALQTQAEITAQQAILNTSSDALRTMTTQGSAAEIASAKLGIATVGDNQSYVTSIITDANGNEVHIDQSGDTKQYYHLDSSGGRVDYDPTIDADQIFNFSMGKDGNAAMMSTNNAPIKRFANIEVNTDAGLLRADEKIATTAIKTGGQTLETLTLAISELKSQEGMLQDDIDQINQIEQQLASGEISMEYARNQLDLVQNSDFQLASLKNDIVEHDYEYGNEVYVSFADSLQFTSGTTDLNSSYAAPINNGTADIASLTTSAFGKDPSTSQPKPDELKFTEEEPHIKDQSNPSNNTGLMG